MDLSINSLLTSIYNFMEEMHEAGALEKFTFTYSLKSNLDVTSIRLYIRSIKKLQKDFKDSLKSVRDYSSISTINFSEQGVDSTIIATDATNNNINSSCTMITNAVTNNNDLLFESGIENVDVCSTQSLPSQNNLISNDTNLMLKDPDISCTSNNLVIPFSKLNIDVSSESFSIINSANPSDKDNNTQPSPSNSTYVSDLVLSNTELYSHSSSCSMPLLEIADFPTFPNAEGSREQKKLNCRVADGKLKRCLTPDSDETRFRTCDQIAFLCCKVCCLACLTVSEYNSHICRANSKEQELSKENLILRTSELQNWKKFICSICRVEFRTYSRILYHLPRCFPGPYNCNSCSMSFTTQKTLNYHKKKIHLGEKCFICEECGRTFERKTSLRKHCVYRHELDLLSTNSFSLGCSSQDHFQCDICSKKFIKKIFLTHHKLRMHGLDKRFLCPTCGNKFMTKNSLLTHMEIHDEEKKFTCTHCMKTFRRKEKLVHHTRIHTGERPFQCSKCKKSFVSKTRLNEHISRHNGARRYCCPDCPKSYAAAWDLKKHVQKKHNKDLESVPVMVIPNSNASIITCQDQAMEPYLYNNKETLSTITPPVVSHHKMQHRLTVSDSFSRPSVSAVERPSISSSAISYSLQSTMESMHLTDNDVMTNTML